MNNEGLDALAALAAAASNTPCPPETGTTNNTDSEAKDKSNGEKSSNHGDTNTQTVDPASCGIAAHQWQQAIANAAASINALANGNNHNNLGLLGLQQLNHGHAGANPSLIALQQQIAMQQQLSYYQLLAHAATQQQRQFVPNSGSSLQQQSLVPNSVTGVNGPPTPNAAVSQVLGVHPQPAYPNMNGTPPIPIASQSTTFPNVTSPSVLQTAVGAVPLLNVAQVPAAQHVPVNPIGFTNQMPQPAIATSLATIAPQPSKQHSSNVGTDWSDDDNIDESEYCSGDKRQMKRVANRKSAQLSRKRKKQFIEELKEENDGLRRKEQILRSIPDLVVVFDSSGKLWFVSESVSKFLDFTAEELEGTSFWNRLCDDSVRLLKAAFMDSLAARQQDAETASLGSGIWELRLVDKDGSRKVVTLHGVVHFAGERPECVCSIRPLDDSPTTTMANRTDSGVRHDGFVSASTSSVASCNNSLKRHRKASIQVHPNQSVVSFSDTNERNHSDTLSSSTLQGSNNRAVRISDSGNSSGSSDSGSGDELNNTEITA